VKNPLSSKNNWYCSGIIQKVLVDSGVPGFEFDPSVTSPRRLEDELKLIGAVQVDYKTVTKDLVQLTS